MPSKAATEPRTVNLSAADLTALAQGGELQGIIAEFLINREVAKPKLLATRTKEEKVEPERLVDENIKPIPDNDFYT